MIGTSRGGRSAGDVVGVGFIFMVGCPAFYRDHFIGQVGTGLRQPCLEEYR
jgi:hypothetical protein